MISNKLENIEEIEHESDASEGNMNGPINLAIDKQAAGEN